MKRNYFKFVSCLIILLLCSGSVSAVFNNGVNENWDNVLDNNSESVSAVFNNGVNENWDNVLDNNLSYLSDVGVSGDSDVGVSDNQVGSIDIKVKSLEEGVNNITFDNGYSGYCVDYNLHPVKEGDTFTVRNCSEILNNDFNKSIGDYLKILFFNIGMN